MCGWKSSLRLWFTFRDRHKCIIYIDWHATLHWIYTLALHALIRSASTYMPWWRRCSSLAKQLCAKNLLKVYTHWLSLTRLSSTQIECCNRCAAHLNGLKMVPCSNTPQACSFCPIDGGMCNWWQRVAGCLPNEFQCAWLTRMRAWDISDDLWPLKVLPHVIVLPL